MFIFPLEGCVANGVEGDLKGSKKVAGKDCICFSNVSVLPSAWAAVRMSTRAEARLDVGCVV